MSALDEGPHDSTWMDERWGRGLVGRGSGRGWPCVTQGLACVTETVETVGRYMRFGVKMGSGGRFLKMGFLAKNGQNGPGLDLYRGRGPMTYLDPRFRVLEFSKLRVPGPARD